MVRLKTLLQRAQDKAIDAAVTAVVLVCAAKTLIKFWRWLSVP